MSDFLNYFDGLMLGDGSLNKNKANINYRYSQKCKIPHKEWLESIKKRFELDGIESNICLNAAPGKYFDKSFNAFINRSGSNILQSHVYDFFTEQEKRWYRNDYNVDEYNTYYWHKDENGEWYARKKIVPKDIKLTPECVANWYMGDGNPGNSGNSGSGNHITLATNSFTKEDVEFLSFLLEDQIVKTIHIYSSVINIGKQSNIHTFLDYVRPCVEQVSCFHYKIPEV